MPPHSASPFQWHPAHPGGAIPILTLKQPCPAPGWSHSCQGPSVAPRTRRCGDPWAGWSSAQRGSGLCLPDPQALSEMDEFKNLDSDIEGSAKRWKKFVESEVPEKEVFPKEWKNKTALQKLCMLRCMRPDRMTYAVRCPKPAWHMQLGCCPARGHIPSKHLCSRLTRGALPFCRNFVEEKMGSKFVEGRSVEFSKSYEESSPSTPVFFILSPGVDPLKDVEALGNVVPSQHQLTEALGRIHTAPSS